ncbi:hypothetical protein D3C80_1605450 [compost metagenome]
MMRDAQVGTRNLQRRRALVREHVTGHAAGQCRKIDRERWPHACAQRNRIRIGLWPGGGVCLPFCPAVQHNPCVMQIAEHHGELLEWSGIGIGGAVTIHEDRGILTRSQTRAQG